LIFPTFTQWKQIFKVLKGGEKITLLVFFVLAISSLLFLTVNSYLAATKTVPTFKGIYIEGVVGQPRFINPLYGETNDIDRSIIELVFSGLMTYDTEGNIVPDLVDSYDISDDGKTYTFELKESVFWHDGKPLTSDDVLFTIKTIQNADYKSPLRANWIGVEAQKLSDTSFNLILKQPYNSFLENCTLKIIPQHIWQNVSPENATLSLQNLQPVGSGPFSLDDLLQNKTGFIQTLTLRSNRRYHGKPSLIAGITFAFFENMDNVIAAANARRINGFAVASFDKTNADIKKIIRQGFSKNEQFTEYHFSLPRYFAVFFNNQKPNILSDANIRKALVQGANKQALIEKIITEVDTEATAVDSPILPDFFGYQEPSKGHEFNTENAKALLDASGFVDKGNGVREKVVTKKPAFQFKNYLKVGSKGTEVTQLQGCLARLPNLSGSNTTIFSDILKNETNGVYGKLTEQAVDLFQKEYLSNLKPTGEVGTSTRQKLNELCTTSPSTTEPLKFTLVTVNQPQLVKTANLLKNDWQALGVEVDIQAVSVGEIKPIIKNRNYDALLYGETLGMEPDLYPFWYSSQKQDPGLNLSAYENKDVDTLLKNARQTLDPVKKAGDLEKIQNTILNDAPALFLYNPDYVYWASAKTSGIDTKKIADPAKRFVNVTNWFISTKRVWR